MEVSALLPTLEISRNTFWVSNLKVEIPNSPTHGHGQLFPEAIAVMKLPVVTAVFMHPFRELHIVATILGDLQQLAFAIPLDGLQAFGGFLHAERRGRN